MNLISKHFFSKVLPAVLLAGGIAVSSATPASAENKGILLAPGETLFRNDQLTNAPYSLRMQTDGNLVLYRNSTACGASHTSGRDNNKAIMQRDGNFVIYNDSGRAIWQSNTTGTSFAQARAVLYQSGKFAIVGAGATGGYKQIFSC